MDAVKDNERRVILQALPPIYSGLKKEASFSTTFLFRKAMNLLVYSILLSSCLSLFFLLHFLSIRFFLRSIVALKYNHCPSVDSEDTFMAL